ncbi:MAG: hypothetical protein IJ654_07395 [Bacteroidales bacterium]|nr:hypothetical protein [Bacteroidales bacterium]
MIKKPLIKESPSGSYTAPSIEVIAVRSEDGILVASVDPTIPEFEDVGF